MLIDFHTHFFPERIAARTMQILRERMAEINNIENLEDRTYPICTDATLEDTKRCMKRAGVDLNVLLPIATRDGQSDNVNNYAEMVNDGKNIISFGSVFPYQKDWEYVICDLADRGFKGIKLHPEGQQFDIDGKEGLRVIKKAVELGMLVVIHAGIDPGFEGKPHSSPLKFRHLMEETDGSRIIAAHLGGLMQWDDVEKYLVGTPINMDISYVSKVMDMEQYRRIIVNHGPEKILFASDCPWQDPEETLRDLRSVNLDEESMELITYKNAKRLLKI